MNTQNHSEVLTPDTDSRFNDSSLIDVGFMCADAHIGATKAWEIIGSGALDVRRIGRLTRITRGSWERYKAALPKAA
jgi:hypothetical protein